MPYERKYIAEKRRFETVFHGHVAADEIVDNYMEMIRAPEWGPDVVRLITIEQGSDVSELTLDLFQNRFVQVLEDTADIAGPPNKNAWVVEADYSQPIFKVWELMPEAAKRDVFRVFTSRDDAIAWLEED